MMLCSQKKQVLAWARKKYFSHIAAVSLRFSDPLLSSSHSSVGSEQVWVFHLFFILKYTLIRCLSSYRRPQRP